jgi:hypothetical protein
VNDKEYIAELEKIVIFLCDVYTKGADSLACQTNDKGETDDKWLNVFMSFPTIQGTGNRIYVDKIGKLRTRLSNREAVKMSFQDLYNRLKVGRKET